MVTTASVSVAADSDTTAEGFLAATGAASMSELAADTVDAVVVEVTIDARGPFDATGSGSGVIISDDGTIVTDAHVVDDAPSITAELNDGRTYAAVVVAQDADADISVLDIDATGLTSVELGSTADVVVGNAVIAIGTRSVSKAARR